MEDTREDIDDWSIVGLLSDGGGKKESIRNLPVMRKESTKRMF
jgi:hypothetical protein